MGRKKCLHDDVEKEALSVAGVEGGEYDMYVHCTVVQYKLFKSINHGGIYGAAQGGENE